MPPQRRVRAAPASAAARGSAPSLLSPPCQHRRSPLRGSGVSLGLGAVGILGQSSWRRCSLPLLCTWGPQGTGSRPGVVTRGQQHGGWALHPSHLSNFSALRSAVAAGCHFVTACVTVAAPGHTGSASRRDRGTAERAAGGWVCGRSELCRAHVPCRRLAATAAPAQHGGFVRRFTAVSRKNGWSGRTSPRTAQEELGGTGPGCLVLPCFHFCAPLQHRGPPRPLGHLGGAGAGTMPLSPPSPRSARRPRLLPTMLLRDVQVASPRPPSLQEHMAPRP